MPINKLNFDLPSSFLRQLSEEEKKLIRNDAGIGISQESDGRRFGSYRSVQYVKYKANYMNRFTDKTGSKGSKLKAYQGRSVRSNQVSFVNMTLTGELMDGLHLESTGKNEFTMSFMPKDAGKIIGARDLDREVVGLNDKNAEKIKDLIIEELNKQVEKYCSEDIIITIGK